MHPCPVPSPCQVGGHQRKRNHACFWCECIRSFVVSGDSLLSFVMAPPEFFHHSEISVCKSHTHTPPLFPHHCTVQHWFPKLTNGSTVPHLSVFEPKDQKSHKLCHTDWSTVNLNAPGGKFARRRCYSLLLHRRNLTKAWMCLTTRVRLHLMQTVHPRIILKLSPSVCLITNHRYCILD